MLARVMAVAIITIGLDGSPWMIQFTYDSCWILDKSTPETFGLWRGGTDPPLWATCPWCSPGQTSQGCMSAAPATLAMIKSLSTLYKVTSVDITLSDHTLQKQKFYPVHHGHGSQSISCQAVKKFKQSQRIVSHTISLYIYWNYNWTYRCYKIGSWARIVIGKSKDGYSYSSLLTSMGLFPFCYIRFQYCQCNSTIYSLLKTSLFFTILDGNL